MLKSCWTLGFCWDGARGPHPISGLLAEWGGCVRTMPPWRVGPGQGWHRTALSVGPEPLCLCQDAFCLTPAVLSLPPKTLRLHCPEHLAAAPPHASHSLPSRAVWVTRAWRRQHFWGEQDGEVCHPRLGAPIGQRTPEDHLMHREAEAQPSAVGACSPLLHQGPGVPRSTVVPCWASMLAVGQGAQSFLSWTPAP